MHSDSFDALARAMATNRRVFLRGLSGALVGAATARFSRDTQAEGLVAPGGTCSVVEDCQLYRGPGGTPEAVACADNGFTSDGERNCCLDQGQCCGSDAECCGELRCFLWPDVCGFCALPGFPTRSLGQPCTNDDDCVLYPPDTRCMNGVCFSSHYPEITSEPLSDYETAVTAAVELSALEVAGDYDALYDRLHPDARAIIPREVVVDWYTASNPYFGASVAEPTKVRFISWEWAVNGKVYLDTAEVAFRQKRPDGEVIRDEVRLVKTYDGWKWFFGRDRPFVDEQIALFG